MAKDNDEANSINNNLPTPSSSGIKRNARSKPYDANNSFVKKVATKVTDLIQQPSWISRWFNSSQDEAALQAMETDNPQYEAYEEKQSQPPPLKRPCIRMDVTHPPGTFAIKPSRNKSTTAGGDADSLKAHFSNHNETTQDFLEPSASGRMPRFVSSTPAFSTATSTKVSDTRPTLNLLISEQNNTATNGVDDNSETSESTSGCSSLIPQNNRQEASNTNFNSPYANRRRYIDNKLDFTNHLQSPRSLFLDRETLSSRRPSFNPMMVTNTLDRSASLQSPFYPGNTMFGGSNAANLYRSGSSILSEASRYQSAPKRASVQVNPSSESTTCDPSMSHTARRILEALEQFSSPLTDAKKMPVHNIGGNSSIFSNNASLNSLSTPSRKRAREDESPSSRVGLRHLTRELTVPTVPDLLRIRRKQKLQRTTVNARKIMSARTAPATVTTQEYHIRTEDETEPKRKAPLKAKKKTNLEEQETVEAVNLPTIALPISNLPRFDISLPRCPKPNISTDKQIQQQSKQQVEKNSAFKFASPIKLTDGAKNLESINNFTFSKPMSPSKLNFAEINDTHELSKTLSIGSNDTLTTQPSFPNFVWSGPSQTLKPKEKEHQKKVPSAPLIASELKSGSVMDFFAKQSATTSSIDQSNVWECNECLIKNSAKETHCVACKNSKHDSSDDIEILECPSEDTNLLEENNLIKSSTKVSSSIHPNTNSSLSKLTSISQASSTIIISKSTDSTINTSSKIFSTTANESLNSSNTSQLNVLKPSKASWECPCCMVRNVETVSTCPCCNTAKPGSINVSPKRKIENSVPLTSITAGFGDKFKKPEGSWSCDSCMLQNKSDSSKCVACETSRPGLTKTNLISTSSSTSVSGGFGDKFKKPEGSWTCDTCMVQNKSDVNKCVACETPQAGASTDSAPSKSSSKLQFNIDMPENAGSFKFGIDKAENLSNLTAATPKTNGFTFGVPTTSSQPISGGFSFGVASDANKSKESEISTAPAFGFKSDAVAATATFQFGAKPVESKDEEEKPPANTAVFQFGAGAVDAKDKKDNNSTTTATFSFGAPSKPDAMKAPSTGFVFGAPGTAEKTNEKESDATPTGGLFIFGAQAANATQTAKDSTADKTIKSTTDVPTNNFVFGSPKSTSDVPKVKDNTLATVETVPKFEPPKSTSLFSAPTEQSKPIAPTFSFGSSVTSTTITPSLSTTSASLFTFGAQPKASDTAVSNTTASLPAFGSVGAPKPTFSFGKPTEPTGVAANQEKNNSTTMFGSTATRPSFGGQANQTTPSLFGSSVPITNASDSKPLMFGTEKKNTHNFGEPDNKIPAFGSTSNKTETSGFGTASPAPSAFGASTTATSPTASPFGSTPNLFGNGAAPSFSTTTPASIFSATTKPPETTSSSSGLFTFGQSSQTSTPASGGFNFSAGSNVASNVDQQKGIFSFGASSNNPQQQVGNGFNTGSFSGASAAPTSSFTFNPPPKPDVNSAASLFGQAAAAPSTTSMFNAHSNTTGQPSGLPPAYPGTTGSTSAASSGFNFGSTNVPNSFNFGSSPAPSTGGFNFNAPSTPAAAPAFDPNAQPTFNFTAGSAPTAFNAPPTRKIKKAVRRMPRQ